MPESSTVQIGDTLSGKYRVTRELGRGGMATVFAADNVDIGKRVAIKLLAGHLAASQTVVERFLREARAVSKIRSPHICDVYDVGRLDDGTPFLVLELLEGESLYDAMVRDRQMSVPVTLAIMLQLCRGLAKAHEASIVHRDLKPENIFLTVDDDGNLLVKILDFGLAKFYDSPNEPEVKGKNGKAAPRLTRDGAVFGTPAYMSPEQVRGQATADNRADLWAVACIAYECFTGATVWKTEEGVAMTFAQIATAPIPDPRAYRPDLPPSFSAWFQKALDRNLEQRFQTVQELADELVLAFDYVPKSGALDPALINQLTQAARTLNDLDAPTVLVPRRDFLRQREEQPVPLVRPSTPAPEPKKLPAEATARHDKAPPPSRARRQDDTPTNVLAPSVRPEAPSPARASQTPPPPAPQPTLVHLDAMRTSRRRALSLGVGVSLAAVVAGLAVAFGSSDPKIELAKRFAESVGQVASAPATSASAPPMAPSHPWYGRIREAQEFIAKGEYERAVSTLRRLTDEVKHPLPKNLLEQAQHAVLAKKAAARCQVTGLGRPRTYDVLQSDRRAVSAGAPAIARGLGGAVVAWSDSSDGSERLSAVALDDALRDVAAPTVVSPDGNKVAEPRLVPMAQRFVVTYTDGVGVPGVYLRWLGANGGAAGEASLASPPKTTAIDVDATRTPEGGLVVAWAEDGPSATSVAYRVYDKAGQPRGQTVRFADYRGAGTGQLRHLRIEARASTLYAAYEYRTPSQQEIRFQAVPLDSAAPGVDAVGSGRTGGEQTLARETVVSRTDEQATEPALGCNNDGCYVAWHDAEHSGGAVAFLDRSASKVQWVKRVGANGRHFAVAMAPNGQGQLAWFDAGKLVLAGLGLEGVGSESRVAKVAPDAKAASLAPGAQRGEWYAAWLDNEGSRPEPYVLRVLCQ